MTDYAIPSYIDKNIFRAYDIRGVVETALTTNTVYAIGCALGEVVKASKQNTVYLARDGRLTGPMLLAALAAGLQAAGCNVINIGATPTAVLYYACATGQTNCGIMITGSHNPPEYNGLKMVAGGKTLTADRIQAIYTRLTQHSFTPSTQQGTYTEASFNADYCDRITHDIAIKRPLKVVIDCGNGIGGAIAPLLFERLLAPAKGELTCLYETVDGTFPNHHPDPSEPANLTDLIQAVKDQQADIGLAFDGDADRLGVVTPLGDIIWPDRQLMLFAQDVLSRHKNGTIIYDVKCSKHLQPVIEQAGGKPLMWKTGHSLIKNKLRDTGALLAGEMSGHIFFKERWYGFDDGLYCGARLLEILSQKTGNADDLFSAIPNSINTPELKLPMPEDKKFTFMQALAEKGQFGHAKVITLDGLRVEFNNGWGLIRPSNTTAYLVLRFEADTQTALDEIMQLFKQQLLAIEPNLRLPEAMR